MNFEKYICPHCHKEKLGCEMIRSYGKVRLTKGCLECQNKLLPKSRNKRGHNWRGNLFRWSPLEKMFINKARDKIE